MHDYSHDAPPDSMTSESAAEPRTLNHKYLMRLAASPVAHLLSGSVWALKAWQLDLEFPPSIQSHLDQRLQENLTESSGKTVDLDETHIRFTTERDPAVDSSGQEHFDLSLSLRQLGRAVLDPLAFLALKRCAEPDRPLHDDLPHLTIAGVFRLLINANWTLEYEQKLNHFWKRHDATWLTLARLSFLDGVCHLHARKRMHTEGYRLALAALGLNAFPRSLDDVQPDAPSLRAVVQGIALNEEIIPGIFHLKSNTTGHCYVHVLGEHPQCVEYISDNELWHPEKVFEALNGSAWHRLHLEGATAGGTLTLSRPVNDVFSLLRDAQQRFSLNRLEQAEAFDSQENGALDEESILLMPIQRAMTLVSALDHWHGEAPIQDRIPTPLSTSNKVMGKWLRQHHRLEVDPRFVFIRYLRGTSTTPWGNPRIAANNVIVTPDEQPVALDQALVNNFRAQQPQGYDDHGGRWVVYTDPGGAGVWAPDAELNISGSSVEAYIDSVDFLELMTRRLKRFWDRQGPAIERSLSSTFVGQVLFSLKSGELSHEAFDLLITAFQESGENHPQRKTRWATLGFPLNSAMPLSTDCPACVGLLLLRHKDQPGGVLYQAGQQTPFVVIRDQQHLTDYLARAAADNTWRETLLHYMPNRFHARLTYILELWGAVRTPGEPVSLLRPWVDPLYNPDTHKARHHALCEEQISGSPIAFMCQGLRRNSHDDAQDAIVTDRERLIHHWTQQAHRLQLLLAPLAMLMPATSIASLTASAATLALSVQAAHLPGHRQAERRQVMFAILTLGLLHMGPATPRLLRAFSGVSTSGNVLSRAQASLPVRGFRHWLQQSTVSRRTLLRPFFNGAGPMKTWTVPGNATFGTEPVQVWKLGRKLLLWTSDRTQARTLVVSSHGYYLPWTRTTAVPNGTELRTYAPHGHELVDPMLHRIVSQQVTPYSLLNSTQPVAGPGTGPFPTVLAKDTLTAGTSLPGHIKNYTLAKFQSDQYESYQYISHIVRNTRQPFPASPLPAVPMDVMTVRSRFGMTRPTLEDLFTELHRHGIHYDRILLVHCRCSAVSSLLGNAPAFHAPRGASAITP
jgi:hypothetical protein